MRDGTLAEVEVDERGLYPDRNIMHRQMGPPDMCDECGGRGYFEDGEGERYCVCAAGDKRRETDGGAP